MFLIKYQRRLLQLKLAFPLIEPELSIRIVTNVSLNSISFSFLNDNEFKGSIIILGSFEVSKVPPLNQNPKIDFALLEVFFEVY